MGINAVSRIRDSDSLRKKLLREFTQEQVNDYCSAVTIRIDLREFDPKNFKELTDYIAYTLYESIRKHRENDNPLVESSKWPEIEDKHVDKDVLKVAERFTQATNRNIFIHWDEVCQEESEEEKTSAVCCAC